MNIIVGNLVQTREEYADIIARISWYFLPVIGQISNIEFFLSNNSIEKIPSKHDIPNYFRKSAKTQISKILPKIVVHICSDNLWKRTLSEKIYSEDVSNLILIFDETKFPKIEASGKKLLAKVTSVDKEGMFYETSNYLYYLYSLSETIKRAETYKHRLSQLKNKYRWGKILLVGSGPSIEKFPFEKYSEYEAIPVNSIVKNKNLLGKIKPKIIIASDPVYHSGPSRYAEKFREALVSAMREFGSFFIFPLRDAEIYEYYLPDEFKEKLIGIPFNYSGNLNYNFLHSFSVNATENVLTNLQIPISAFLSDDISMVGYDGRGNVVGDKLWNYSNESQFNEEIDTLMQCHPSFFRRDNEKYLKKHDAVLGQYFLELNRQKKIKSLTKSDFSAINAVYSSN